MKSKTTVRKKTQFGQGKYVKIDIMTVEKYEKNLFVSANTFIKLVFLTLSWC